MLVWSCPVSDRIVVFIGGASHALFGDVEFFSCSEVPRLLVRSCPVGNRVVLFVGGATKASVVRGLASAVGFFGCSVDCVASARGVLSSMMFQTTPC